MKCTTTTTIETTTVYSITDKDLRALVRQKYGVEVPESAPVTIRGGGSAYMNLYIEDDRPVTITVRQP